MIYYIVAIDPATHNEWVISTHDSVVSATKFCDQCRKQGTGYEYRIDTAEENAIRPLITPEEIHAARNRKPFTAKELFTDDNRMVSDCTECGAYVRIPQHAKHAAWHNKVADL